jgi:hypothetical protein
MVFDIRQNLFDRDGMPVEKKVGHYLQELIRLFRESLEGQALEDEGLYPGFWVNSTSQSSLHRLHPWEEPK